MYQPTGTSDCFTFGENFELDARAYELRSDGIPLKLKPIPMELLLLLLERPGQLVTREQIVERIWGAGIALDTDNSINGAISRIRQVLRDDPEQPKYVQTVPSRGYRFIASVERMNRGREARPMAAGSTTPTELAIAGTLGPAREIQRPTLAAGENGRGTVQENVTRSTHSRWKPAVVAAVILAMIGGGLALRARSRQAKQLTERDTIVVADFANNTGDSIFDETLKQALSVELTQSPFLNVASDVKVSEMLRRMGRSAGEGVSGEVAREVCLRLGGKAVLQGSISSLGSHYVVSLQALGCASGDVLAAAQQEAANKESVLKALDGVASQVRGKAGESMASLEKYDFPTDATTNSLEALKAFSLGLKALRERGEGEALPFLRQATDVDPDFALAYATLGRAYEDVGEDNAAAVDFEKAFELRGRLSERERYYVTALYNEIVTGDMEQAKETGELWVRAYPRDGIAREKLGTIYGELGDNEKANVQFEEALRLDPDSTINVFNSVMVKAALNQMQEAAQILAMARARGVDGAPIHAATYALAFLRADATTMEKEVAWSEGKAITEEGMLSQHSDTQGYYGRMRKARDLSKRAVDAGMRDQAREIAALCELSAALREVETGDRSSVKRSVEDAIDLAPSRSVKIMAALVLARSGNAKTADALIKELESGQPSNTLIHFFWVPVAQASLALEAGDAETAISLLEKARPYELSQLSNLSNVTNLYPIYIRGQAYLMMKNSSAAAGEFQKILNNGGIVQNGILGALAKLQLARAEAGAGDGESARKHYGEFFVLWKDADANTTISTEAKIEYAKLH